jgi:coenzyme PQQ precursor peptide PqqA
VGKRRHVAALQIRTLKKFLEKQRSPVMLMQLINQYKNMKWIKPEFEEISLSMEVTAYVNAGK